MSATDYYEILNVPRNATQKQIKDAFHVLAYSYHPDHNPTPDAAAFFKKVTEAYKVLSDPVARKRYDDRGTTKPLTLKSRRHAYEVGALVSKGDLADIYKATNEKGEHVALKVVREAPNSDLLKTEWDHLQKLFAKDDKHTRYFAAPIETFQIEDASHARRQVNVMEWLNNWWTFDEVRTAFRRELRMEHGVWMFNRILGGLGFAHKQGVLHGAVVPSHTLAYSSGKEKDPWNHGVKLVDWCYSIPMGTPLKAIVPKYRDFYPPEVFAKKPAIPSTDIYMAAKCVIYVLGGNPKTNQLPDHVPGYLANFLKGCTLGNLRARPQRAWELHQELKEHMRENFGPRKYVRFDMPAMG